MRILYLSMHPVLEFDEIRLFESLGHRVFSIGGYLRRGVPNNFRPMLPETPWHKEMLLSFDKEGCSEESRTVTRAFASQFDCIVVMHYHEWIARNLPAFGSIPVVLRSIGQAFDERDSPLQKVRDRLCVVRYSERENLAIGSLGCDVIVPFYKNHRDFFGWLGAKTLIPTFYNNPLERLPKYIPFYEEMMAEVGDDRARVFYGWRTNDLPYTGGLLDYGAQLRVFRDSRAFFHIPSFPAPYTLLFMEGWMSGIPMIIPSRQLACRLAGKDEDRASFYEIDEMIEDRKTGFIVSSVEQAAEVGRYLLRDYAAAYAVGQAGRKAAMERFGFERIRAQWVALLKRLVPAAAA